MNIFFSDSCPQKCAQFLDTKRVNKMILESAQMLCTALRVHGCEDPSLYKEAHKNHPSTIWVRESRDNYNWLLQHFFYLHEEKVKRTGKSHKSFELYNTLLRHSLYIPAGSLTKKPNCAANQSLGINYKHIEDVYTAYKTYLKKRWELDKRKPTWK